MNKIPILIDFDGVIKLGDDLAPDAGEFFKFITKNNLNTCIISNSTLRTGIDVTQFFVDKDLSVEIPVMTAVDATINYVKDHYKKVSVYCVENIKELFADFIDDQNPEAVVIGDNGNKWDFQLMNEIFQKVFNGADIIAMQMNRYWYPQGGELSLDAGSFIKAIEYGSAKEAILIGKPSSIYFHSALQMLGYQSNSEFIMIGDDIESDIIGAQKAGGKGLLIYTGKTKFPLANKLNIKPDYEAKNLRDVIEIINTI
jgi:HAD superfamily hydrolase (TIGR01458 family)